MNNSDATRLVPVSAWPCPDAVRLARPEGGPICTAPDRGWGSKLRPSIIFDR